MADYRMPLSTLPGHVLAKILCDVAESETQMGLVELLEARGYGTLLLFLNTAPRLLNWLVYVNTRTWVRLTAEPTFAPVARDVAEMLYTSRVHDLCDLVRLGGSTATTARALLQRLRDSGAYAAGSPQATLLDDGIAGNPQRYLPVPHMPGPTVNPMTGVRGIDFQTLVYRSALVPEQYGPLEVWDTRNVTSMRSAFMPFPDTQRALDLAFWDTRKVLDMADMFLTTCRTRWTVAGLLNWNTSSVYDMSRMFFNCDWTPDVEDWVTSSVVDASSMFGCSSDSRADYAVPAAQDCGTCNPDVSRWDTRALENAEKMFMNLVHFNRDLSRWDVRRLRSASHMFLNARSFDADLGKWDMRSVDDVTGMFDGCPIPESHKPRVTERGRVGGVNRPVDIFVGGKLQFV
jgi:hypothetical protein